MAVFTPRTLERRRARSSRATRSPKSALIPLCHLAQEQDGYLTDDAMEHIAELLGVTPAEVLGTASFYEMFKRQPVGKYVVNMCTNISCLLIGGDELLAARRGARSASRPAPPPTTACSPSRAYECIAACTEAPCLQVNYRYFHKITTDEFDTLVDDLRAGRPTTTIPPHGTLARMRQRIPAERAAGPVGADGRHQPVWLGDAAGCGTAASTTT